MPQERFSLLQTETTVIEREFMKGYTSTGVILHGLFLIHRKIHPVNQNPPGDAPGEHKIFDEKEEI